MHSSGPPTRDPPVLTPTGSLRHRVPILDGEYFHEWKNEMLEIFNEYHLNKYIASPCAPHVDPMHPIPLISQFT